MIRKLTEQDHTQLMTYLEEEKTFNLFIIGDIENFGYEQEFQEIWGEFNEHEEIIAVLLRYYGSYLPYAKGDFDIQAFAEIVQMDPTAEMLSGKLEMIEKFEPFVSFTKQKNLYFAEMKEAAAVTEDQTGICIHKATVEDCDPIHELKEQITEFQLGKTARESFRHTIETNTGRAYFYREGNEILACASTTAENSFSAMVVGVCTHPRARRRGLATLCVQQLSHDLLQEGKSLCLFYDNPAAGSIYRRIGFREIGQWSMSYL